MQAIKLKISPEFFQDVKSELKNFEIRFNDRDYQVGDILILEEYDKHTESYSGESVTREVTYITDFNQPFSQVVMGIKKVMVE
jgi:hypothetical protein